jgi:hypothetical protein
MLTGTVKPKLTPKEKKAAADKARRERQREQARLKENRSVAEVPVAEVGEVEVRDDKSMVAECGYIVSSELINNNPSSSAISPSATRTRISSPRTREASRT